MPQLSALSPSRLGFMPLSKNSSGPHDNEIPLTQISTHSPSSREGLHSTTSAMDADNEKHSGVFRRKTTVKKPAGRRKVVRKIGENGRVLTDGEEFRLNGLGKVYNKIIGFSAVTRYLVYILPLGLLLAIPLVLLPVFHHKDDILLGSFTEDNAAKTPHAGPTLFNLFLWIEISFLSLWVAKIVAHMLPAVFEFLIGVVSVGTRKYALVLKNLEIPFSLFFSSLASWLVFKFMFTDDAIAWVSVIKKILGASFVSSAVFLIEKTFVQLVGVGYNQRSYASRISDSKHEVYLLGALYEASRTLFPMYGEDFLQEDYAISDSLGYATGTSGAHKKSGSVTPLNLVGGVGRLGDKAVSAFGNLAGEITGKKVFNPNSAHSIVVEALEKVPSSEALGRRIWMSFVTEGSTSLEQADLIEVLGPGHEEEAQACFETLDTDQNGDISLEEMVRKVIEIGKERRAIANSVKDIGQALKVFDSVLLFLVLLIVIFIFLSFFQSSFITTLATAGTALLSLSFVFAATTQEFLGSVIFLFVKHPFDVGDRVDIDTKQLTVERISLLYTVFTRIDKMQMVQMPNLGLASMCIENVTRSKAMKETFAVDISFDTSFEDIELLRVEMEKFVRDPDNSRDFQPDFSIGIGGVSNLDKIELKVTIKHKSNWHNDAVRATRRSKFMSALALAMRKVPINGPGGGGDGLGSAANPSYSVAVNDQFAASARDKSSQDKDEKRMVPKDAKPSGNAEKNAAAELNTRPATDGLEVEGNRNDGTGVSRSASAERQRTENIEQIRSDLKKQESSRGRRKAGEGLPAATFGQNGATSTSMSQSQGGHRQRTMPQDVEAQQGMSTYGGGGYAPGQPQPLASHSSQAYQQGGYGNGLQPSASQGSYTQYYGARPRGSSLSQPAHPQQQQLQQQQYQPRYPPQA